MDSNEGSVLPVVTPAALHQWATSMAGGRRSRRYPSKSKGPALVCEAIYCSSVFWFDVAVAMCVGGEGCCYCDAALSFTSNGGPNQASVDRLDPRLGYVGDNVVVCCQACNSIKHDYTPKQLETYQHLGPQYRKLYERVAQLEAHKLEARFIGPEAA